MNRRLCCRVFLLLSVLSYAYAQPNTLPAAGGSDVTGSSIPRERPEGLIHLDVLVTRADGKPVTGLTRADFSLLEQGRSQKILSFEAFDAQGSSSEPPVKIILLIDTITLPGVMPSEERVAVETYLRKNGGHLVHPTSVFLLSDTGLWTLAKASGDGNVLAREIEHNDIKLLRRNAGWQTNSSNVLPEREDLPPLSALKALGQIACAERTWPGRKLLLWVGPGWNIGSGANVATTPGTPPLFNTVWWFSDLLREAHLALYSFSVGEISPNLLYEEYLPGVTSPHKTRPQNLNRRVLAVQSGGRVMNGFDLEELIENCVREAGPFYRISFDPFPADHPHEYHDLKVVVDQPDLIARTSTGYYDQPYYQVDPIPAPTRVSVAQLEQLLEASHGESDADLAKQLAGLALTERLSESRLSSLDAMARGKHTRQELRILADSSAFLKLPADEIPSDPPPDLSTQQHMLSLVSTYLSTTLHKLPDLFARQKTVRYLETPMYHEGDVLVSYRHLHISDSWATTVRYRNGNEIVDTEPPRREPHEGELITKGVFGPALAGVLEMIDHRVGLTWSRWEQGGRGRLAVFHYVIPMEKSVRPVWLCCLPDADGKQAYQRYAGYEGEIAMDPEDGAILRLTVHTDQQSTTPLARSDILIEYGPVDIGGKTYICPVKSISIDRARSVNVLAEWNESFMAYGPYSTMLNDIVFDRYHVFRSESRVLTGFTPSDK
jgi:VWFA-related protein